METVKTMDCLAKTDVVGIFKLLSVLFPQSAKNFTGVDSFARDAWYEMVKDLPKELVAEAIKSYAASHVFAPSIAEIRTEVLKAANPELQIGADEAWGMVRKAISKYGSSSRENYLKMTAEMPVQVMRCIENLGWRNICMSEEPDMVRAHFYRAYDAQINRESQSALVPESVKNRLQRLAGAENRAQIEG